MESGKELPVYWEGWEVVQLKLTSQCKVQPPSSIFSRTPLDLSLTFGFRVLDEFNRGVCTTMKTAEITRTKNIPIPLLSSLQGEPIPPSLLPQTSLSYFLETFRSGGFSAINKGVNAVALRQVTNWGSRIGISRAAEEVIRDLKGMGKGEKLGVWEKVGSSAIGGVLGCWNHPIEGEYYLLLSLSETRTDDEEEGRTLSFVFGKTCSRSSRDAVPQEDY